MKKINFKFYIYDILSSFVSIGSIYFARKFLGASTSFVKTAEYFKKFISPKKIRNMEYFVNYSVLKD